VDEPVTYPAAPTPPGVLLAVRVGAGIGAAALLWGALVVRGSGVGGLLGIVALACAAPALWQAAMTPSGYTVSGDVIAVHRRWLRDSRFTMRGAPERLAAAEARDPSTGRGVEGYGEEFARISRRRTFRAVTDARKGISIPIGRQGALVISPDDPDAFLRARRSW
jgi:hypothetical protein